MENIERYYVKQTETGFVICEINKTIPLPFNFIKKQIAEEYAKEFVEKALEISMDSTKIAMFLKLTFLEGKARKILFKKYPPKTVYVFSSRVKCAKNGDFASIGSSAVAYAWFIWEKGFKGEPIIKWFN